MLLKRGIPKRRSLRTWSSIAPLLKMFFAVHPLSFEQTKCCSFLPETFHPQGANNNWLLLIFVDGTIDGSKITLAITLCNRRQYHIS